jgi:peptidoglycan/xylan/chitin deacetylase (PgdA/CDA1 family)
MTAATDRPDNITIAPVEIAWPDGAGFALGLSHDVDRVAKRGQFPFYLGRAVLRGRPGCLGDELRSLAALLRGDDPYWNFDRIRELEERLGVRSTFFFLDETGRPRLTSLRSNVLYRGRYRIAEPAIARVIRELDAGGWEVGLHGSYRSYLDAELLGAEKARLEEILGRPVVGVRQHYLRLAVPETWRIQAKIGLGYDSSLGFTDRAGWRWDARRPFRPVETGSGRPLPVLQLPMTAMDGTLLVFEDPWRRALELIAEAEESAGLLVINWHQRVFNPWQEHRPMALYERIVRECQERGAWVTHLGAVHRLARTAERLGQQDG